MKFVALISGGKDSIYAIMESIRNGHEIIACAHLEPRCDPTDHDESYMYQTAGSECISTMVEECLGLPLVKRKCKGLSQDRALVYNSRSSNLTEDDEVEDLYQLLSDVKTLYPCVAAVSSGAILSTYQRTRIESVCLRLNLTNLAYLWRIGSQRRLLQCMVEDGIDAVLVKVASPPGLIPRKHLNKSIRELLQTGLFERLEEKYDFHVCGEGGEYETLTLDCPLFKKKILLTKTEIYETVDGVGILKVIDCCAVEKDSGDWKPVLLDLVQRIKPNEWNNITDKVEVPNLTKSLFKSITPRSRQYLPHIQCLPGGLACISELYCPFIYQKEAGLEAEMNAAEREMAAILELLSHTLSSITWLGTLDHGETTTALDVVFVHLYLSSMSYFTPINQLYKTFFGTILPPSRTCVAVSALPGGRRIMLSCIIQRGSGDYMRVDPSTNDKNNNLTPYVKNAITNSHSTTLRSTLHVQSISHWAPVCIGPYSQANMLRSGPIFLAGQIGLEPASMKLISDRLDVQLRQAWKNAAAVLEAVDGTLKNSYSAIIYIRSDITQEKKSSLEIAYIWNIVESICQECVSSLCISTPDKRYEGYEDEETWQAIRDSRDSTAPQSVMNSVPLLMVAVKELPASALTEIELVCASSSSASVLGVQTACEDHEFKCGMDHLNDSWNLGYDGSISREEDNNNLTHASSENTIIRLIIRSCGSSSSSCLFVAASTDSSESDECSRLFYPSHEMEILLVDMIRNSLQLLKKNAGLSLKHVLHVRLFYVDMEGDDGVWIRLLLQAALSRLWSSRSMNRPAFTVIPVQFIKISSDGCKSKERNVFIAMQIHVMDLVHFSTELWVHSST